jgi:hypothetical protein
MPFRRDTDTGEEIAHHITTPYNTTFVTRDFAHVYEGQPGYTVQEVRGTSRPDGFVIERTIN